MSGDLLCPTLPYQTNHLNGFIDNEFLESGQSFGHFSVLKTPPLWFAPLWLLIWFLLGFFFFNQNHLQLFPPKSGTALPPD